MSITRLDHIAIATDNLEKSLHFFEKALGLTCNHFEELPERGIRVAMLQIGDTRLELMTPLSDKSEISGFLEKRGPGIHHLAFFSTNLPADCETLKKEATLTTPAPTPGADGKQVIFVHPKSTRGVLVEVCGEN